MSGRRRTALIAVPLLALAASGAKLMDHDSSDPVEVTAMFADASPLVVGNVVKAAGVNVGKVTDIDLDGNLARVRMELDPAVLPLHQDLTATITTQDLLGERFIKLDPGSPDQPALRSPIVISETQTNRVVDLQDVLNSLDTPASTALASLLTETGEGLRGQGANARKAIAALQPAMTQVNGLAKVLDGQNALLTRLVDNAAPVAAALANGQGQNLDRLVGSATDTLAIVAANREALRQSLDQLPGTIASARSALAELAGVADPATRTLRSLRPITDDLNDITGELQRFADAADPALASLPPVLAKAEALIDQAGPLVRALRPAAADLVGVSASARTLSERALSSHLGSLLEFVKGWSMATSDYDAISHYFKAIVPLSPQPLGHTAGGLVPGVSVPSLPVPTAPTLPLPPKGDGNQGGLPVIGDLIGGVPTLLPGQTSANDSATGLTEPQENNLVEQLLGGLL
jgi:phospholipid/cholesterol/gamma-HCH transport system substrate-binding protein